MPGEGTKSVKWKGKKRGKKMSCWNNGMSGGWSKRYIAYTQVMLNKIANSGAH